MAQQGFLLIADITGYTMIGAVGLAALIHPQRMQFLRSPAPWVAIAFLVVAMIPHFIWLKQVDFVPFTYAGDIYSLTDRHMLLFWPSRDLATS